MTKVLIVEDNFFNMFATTSIFQQYSIDADTASDGFQAIEMVRKLFDQEKRTYDLIIMDQ